MKGTVSGFTPSRGPNPDSTQVARAGRTVEENSSNQTQNVCLGGFFLESASIFPISCHNKVILKKRWMLSGISQVDGISITYRPSLKIILSSHQTMQHRTYLQVVEICSQEAGNSRWTNNAVHSQSPVWMWSTHTLTVTVSRQLTRCRCRSRAEARTSPPSPRSDSTLRQGHCSRCFLSVTLLALLLLLLLLLLLPPPRHSEPPERGERSARQTEGSHATGNNHQRRACWDLQ